MEKVYMLCLGLGIGIPLAGLVLDGIFDGLFDLLDIWEGFDLAPHTGWGHGAICLLPLSMLSICGGLLFFGASGLLLPAGWNARGIFGLSLVIGYLAALGFQNIIIRLRRVENTTLSTEQLLLFDAKVIHKIQPNGFGAISVSTFDGITTSYPAKAAQPDWGIPQDVLVRIVRFDGNVAIVEEKSKSRWYEEQERLEKGKGEEK